MPFLELTVRCREAEQPRYEHALEDVGALAVTMLDAGADTPDEHAILEPGVGETPLWDDIALSALFPHDADALLLLAALEAFDPALDWSRAAFRRVEDQDWERAWMDQYAPLRFGARTWIVPWNHDLPDDARDADAAVVRLDPGLAFGSGTHPTTALCLEWLDGLDLAGKQLIDFGCGSGVLALAALKLGAAQVIGIDNDPQALQASHDNAERNAVADRLELYAPEDFTDTPADVFVANILAGPLAQLAPRFARSCKPGAPFAISGILRGQHEELLTIYAQWFERLQVSQREDWVRIDGRRRS